MFGGVFDSAAIEKAIAEKEKLTEAPGFWDDHEAAEKVMAQIRRLKNRVEPWRKIIADLDDIDAMYFASADPEALSDDLTTSEVYVMSDSFRAGKTSVRTIEEIKTLLGMPLYDGESTVIFPEAVLISRLKGDGKIYDEVELSGTEQFTDVTTVKGYNRAAVVYLYSFEKDGLIYEFICGSAQGAFEFYRIRQA